jgi:hypothetical protein
MSEEYKHLFIQKENLQNDRRTDNRRPQPTKRDDLRSHAQKLEIDLSDALRQAKRQVSSEDGNYVLKLKYSGGLAFDNLEKHGVEFVSHEDKEVCIVFSDNDGLAKFSDHLKTGLFHSYLGRDMLAS